MRLLLSLLALLLFVTPAHAADELGTGICETTSTTGTGTLNLAGAYTTGGITYLDFVSQITSTNVVPYTIQSSDGKFEAGEGTFTDATPDTLSRTASWSSDGVGAELTLPAGTHVVCLQASEQNFIYDTDYGDVVVSSSGTAWAVDANSVALTTDTSGDYVATAADGTGIDGTATGEGSTYTPSFDATELSTVTFGSSNFTNLIFSNAGTFDITLQFNSSNVMQMALTDAGAAGPTFRLLHDSSTPADGDLAGRFEVNGGADDELIGKMAVEIDDGSTTSEDTQIQFAVKIAGAETQVFYMNNTDPGAAVTFANTTQLGLDGNLPLRIYETDANGDNYKAFTSAAANTADTTCTFENDANFIPDSCVGDGSDASDGRIKANLKLAGDVGALIDGIKIYDYQWTADAPEASEDVRKGKSGFGPVAQELFQLNSDWVEVGGEDPIKDPWTWKPEKLVPYLIVEIQNLRKRLVSSTCYGIKFGSACIGVSL
jgi:hypothetical protein